MWVETVESEARRSWRLGDSGRPEVRPGPAWGHREWVRRGFGQVLLRAGRRLLRTTGPGTEPAPLSDAGGSLARCGERAAAPVR